MPVGRLKPATLCVPRRPRGRLDSKSRRRGGVLDFHALRTTFISWLGASGAHPRVAQTLARHASVETTMERYTDLRLFDLKGIVERLPLPGTQSAHDWFDAEA